MSRKPGLTVAEHRVTGSDLKDIRNRLVHLAVQLGNSYPRRESLVKQVEAALNRVDQLRSDLDTKLAIEHPDEFDTKVYYGQ